MYWLLAASVPAGMASVPPSTVKLPEKVFAAESVSEFGPTLVSPPLPLRTPDRVMLPPVVSIVALPARVMSSEEDQGERAPNVPPEILTIAG